MEFRTQDLVALERLAGLELGAEEREELRRRLTRLAELLSELDAAEPLEGAAQPIEYPTPPLRPDEPGPVLDPEFLLRTAPAREGDHFAVPRALPPKP